MNTSDEKTIRILAIADFFVSDKENFIDLSKLYDNFETLIGWCIAKRHSRDKILSSMDLEDDFILDLIPFAKNKDFNRIYVLIELILTIYSTVLDISIRSIIESKNLYPLIENAKTQSDYIHIYNMINS